jgi:AraC family transcriptional regulator
MTNYEIIQSSIRYIEERIRENISVAEIADDAGYSSFYFIRLFSGATGFTPKEYVLKRKLTEAAKEILCTEKRILDVAFEYDFQSHESFTRAFHREFGDNPAAFRKRRSFPEGAFLEPLTLSASGSEHGEVFPDPEPVQLDRICFVGLCCRIHGNYSEIGRMWNEVSRGKQIIQRRILPERFYQLNYCSDSVPEGEFLCMAAIQVSDLSDVPVSFVGKTVPAARYLKFIHRGISSRVVQTYDYIYTRFLPGTSYKLTQSYNLEFYGERFKGPMNPESESEIYIPVE